MEALTIHHQEAADVPAPKGRISKRRFWLLVHRVNGLLLATFLACVGFTGACLAYREQLDKLFYPALRTLHPSADSRRIDPIDIAQQLSLSHAGYSLYWTDLHTGDAEPLHYILQPPHFTSESSWQDELYLDVFVDPFTGQITGERLNGSLQQGVKNLIPFLYRLHASLALGSYGGLALGVAALLWTFDCFVGLYLTWPARQPKRESRVISKLAIWAKRWRPSWMIRWSSGYFKWLYDSHRATGLWLWMSLLIFAWSGVAFNLSAVYQPVMHIFGAQERPVSTSPHTCSAGAVDWRAARETARRLLQQTAAREQWSAGPETMLRYFADDCLFDYRAQDARDPNGYSDLKITFHPDSTRPESYEPLAQTTRADRLTEWIGRYHEALLFGPIGRLLVCTTGLVTAFLAITGILISLRKMVIFR